MPFYDDEFERRMHGGRSVGKGIAFVAVPVVLLGLFIAIQYSQDKESMRPVSPRRQGVSANIDEGSTLVPVSSTRPTS